MQLFIPKELEPGETRVPILPATVKKLVDAGAEIRVEKGLGDAVGITDADYKAAGADVVAERAKALGEADMVLRLNKPPADEISQMKKGAIHVSQLDPFRQKELVEQMTAAGLSVIAMEMIPRTTLAQKMDSLSSQANLAGYVAVLMGADRLDRIAPMMSTPAGTLKPSRIFVIGAGVAGLQAIATAKRLGAIVEAFDTRPVVEEQVRSLGGRFVKIDLGETGQTKDGYATALTEEQVKKQQAGMAKHCASADLVITTAQVFGKPAPRIITKEMVAGMRPGSVIVDLAADTGGNVDGTVPGEEVVVNGVKIVGIRNLPGRVPMAASEMYSSNLGHLVSHFWDAEAKAFKLNLEDEIMDGALIAHEGVLRSEMVKSAWESA